MEEAGEEASVPCVYLPSGLLGQGAGDDEVKVSMKSVQPWRERTHPHKDLHVLPKSAVSMDTKSPAYRLGEPPAPLPLSSFTPFSHFPALPSSLLHICLPWGAPYSCIPVSSLPLPHIPPRAGLHNGDPGVPAQGPSTLSAAAQLPGSPSILLYPSANV